MQAHEVWSALLTAVGIVLAAVIVFLVVMLGVYGIQRLFREVKDAHAKHASEWDDD
jgi:hypothetical protein